MSHLALTLRLGASNVYLVRGADSYVAIDAGPDYEGAWEAASKQLTEAAITPSAVRCVLLTHAHADHGALSSRWQAAGAQVWVAVRDAARLRAGGPDPGPSRLMVLDFLEANGVPSELIVSARTHTTNQPGGDRTTRIGRRGEHGDRLRNLRSVAVEHGEWPGPLRPTPAEPDRYVQSSEPLDLGSACLVPIACPGHTPGSTVFLDETAGDLFTGDHLLERIAPTPGIHFTEDGVRMRSLPQYLRSLDALRPLDVRRILPGHGEPFADLPGAIARITAMIEQRANRLLRRLRDGPSSAWELAHRLYPHLPESATWIVMAEIAGLLDLLAERGLVELVPGPPIRFATRP